MCSGAHLCMPGALTVVREASADLFSSKSLCAGRTGPKCAYRIAVTFTNEKSCGIFINSRK